MRTQPNNINCRLVHFTVHPSYYFCLDFNQIFDTSLGKISAQRLDVIGAGLFDFHYNESNYDSK